MKIRNCVVVEPLFDAVESRLDCCAVMFEGPEEYSCVQ